MKNRFFKWSHLCVAIAGLCAVVYAVDYLGADGVLQQVAEHNAKPGEKSDADAQSKFREELKAFSKAATQLPPSEAAKQWLELADRAVKLQQQASLNYVPGSTPIEFNDLLGALPPPPAWNDLAKAIAARPAVKGDGELREMGLRFLAATLTGDKEGQNREIARLSAKAKESSIQSAYAYRNYLEQISQALMAQSDNPDAVLKTLERQLDSAAQARRERQLEIPNLVAQVGAEKSESFLRKALVTPNIFLGFRQPNETSQLAQKLAQELISELKQPQWGLINSLSAVELYEAMEKRFPAATNKTVMPGISTGDLNLPDDLPVNTTNEYKKQGAQIYYLLGLISKGRSTNAVAVAKKLDGRTSSYMFSEAFKAMQRAGFTDAMDDFFYELLTQNPALPFWEQYVETAAQAGTTKRMLTTVRKALDSTDLSESKKNALHQIFFRALLADDSTNEAVEELRRLTTADEVATGRDGLNPGQLAALLARLGVLLDKPEWTEEGIKAARQWLATSAGKNNDNSENVSGTLAEILFDLNRGPEAEAVLLDALAAATAPGNPSRGNYWEGSPSLQALTELAALYHKAGRHADVLLLLEHSPDWGAGDVSALFNTSPGEERVSLNWLHTGVSPLPVPYLAAKALIAEGKTEPAQKITDDLLARFPGLDRGYELLIAINGTNSFSRLDELFQRDQFEERPLIWKAHLLREQNQLESAEKLLRQAISIDPSDGEEGRGDRMRVYTELAEVREARGDKKEADFFREVVKAIRLSERADQFYSVGLLKRAVAMYAEGLSHFSDAYCIQSRMAIQLSALGMNEAAEEHYRRAYELMPDSFGRVESHCFGCERAFEGERPQSIAEKVFTKMAQERPEKPQIHYLLGYLREEQERYNEARTNYQTAVRLDPDYLNAWAKLQTVSQQILMPPKERNDIVFNILRLDPLQRHAQPNGSRVSDLPGLWNAVATAVALQPATSTNLLALPASKLALEKKPKEQSDNFYHSSYTEREFSPASAIGENPFVILAGQMIFNSRQMDE